MRAGKVVLHFSEDMGLYTEERVLHKTEDMGLNTEELVLQKQKEWNSVH